MNTSEFSRRFLLMAFIVLQLSSCSKDDMGQTETGPIGSITEEEFNASVPPTYDDFTTAYQKVLDDDASLLNDTDKLSRVIFDEIRANYAPNSTAMGSDEEIFFNGESFMNRSEWRLVLTYPKQAYIGLEFISTSYESALTYFPCDEDVSFIGAKATAFKQAYWSALMAKNTSLEFAERLSAAREVNTENQAFKTMNRHNNDFGIELVSKFPNASNAQLFELLIQENYFLVNDIDNIHSDLDGLVFFNGIREFDTIMKGSFGNPDSGGPWDMTINFSQCWNVVRGRFTIVRGEALQERRFTGVLENGKITMGVSDPFVFENPEGLQACVGMIMTLEGDNNGLTGGWISSNCPLGGAVTLD